MYPLSPPDRLQTKGRVFTAVTYHIMATAAARLVIRKQDIVQYPQEDQVRRSACTTMVTKAATLRVRHARYRNIYAAIAL